MMTDIDSIWITPPDRALDIMPALLAAHSPAEIWTATLRFRTDYADGIEDRLSRQLDELDLEPEEFNTDEVLRRGMRPGQMDRAVAAWDGLTDLFRRRKKPGTGNQPLQFGMPLIETWPAHDLGFAAEEIDAETSRLRDEIGALISADRKTAPLRISLPGTAFDFLAEEDWTDQQAQLVEIEKITAYWPPCDGKPALALAESQEDSAQPITLLIYAHAETGHAALLRLVHAVGGKIE